MNKAGVFELIRNSEGALVEFMEHRFAVPLWKEAKSS